MALASSGGYCGRSVCTTARSLGTIIVFDLCLSPSRGLSIRVRRELDRGDVWWGKSESDEEAEAPLDIEGDIEGRGTRSLGSDSVIETGSGKGAVAVDADDVLRIWCVQVSTCLSSALYMAFLLFQLWSTNVLDLPNSALAVHRESRQAH
jgi:hypothetical protein